MKSGVEPLFLDSVQLSDLWLKQQPPAAELALFRGAHEAQGLDAVHGDDAVLGGWSRRRLRGRAPPAGLSCGTSQAARPPLPLLLHGSGEWEEDVGSDHGLGGEHGKTVGGSRQEQFGAAAVALSGVRTLPED
ncbi:hypothetical protein ZWY2020_031971 [Hordeum vulgare]|nr:hypothetical protein ZWY2020_031971 [Hordeum vulgare]